MNSDDRKQLHIAPFIRELYPDAPQEQLEEAQRNLAAYLAVALRIQERVRQQLLDSENPTGDSRFDNNVQNV